jgi:glycosyltransferase involved in cell wall biosynthesis
VRLVRREQVDLIHSHLGDQNFYGCVAGKLTGVKTIVTYHGAPKISKQQGLRRAIKTWFVRSTADTVVVVSDYLRRILLQEGFPASKIVRIYNGVDLGRFEGNGNRSLRAELGMENRTPLVGTVANLRRSKGYEYFIRAARILSDSLPGARFLAIGEIDETLGRPLRDAVRALGLEDRFFFLGFRPDIPSLLAELDVFVLASTDEGLSIATMEAMAARRPVVVTKSGGPQEIVEDGKTGLLVPPADAGAMAAKVLQVLNDPELGQQLGRNARLAIEGRFSLDQMLREYEAVYLSCLDVN